MKRKVVLVRVFVCLVLCSLVLGGGSVAASMLQTDDPACPCPEDATTCVFYCPLAPCDHSESEGGTTINLGDLFGGTTDTSDADLAKVEAKLDAYGPAITDLRQRLDSLGWWLGRLTNGAPLRLGPQDTNPMPQTNTWEQLARLEAKLDRLVEQPSDITIIEEINTLIVDINQWIINLGGNTAALEVKLDNLEAWLNDQFDWLDDYTDWLSDALSANNAAIKANTTAALEVKLDNLEAWLNDQFDWLDDYTDWLSDTLSANNAAIKANTTAISNLAAQVQAVLASNYRIEDMLKQQQGYPAAPDGSKITLIMGGGPLPSVPWDATVAGTAGAVVPNSLVTIYWPIGLPPSTVTADANGSFSLFMTTGNVTYFAVEVTQTDTQGRESARTQILVSP